MNNIESIAITIYWAAWELYPPRPENPVSKFTKETAWEKTSEEHRRLARFQARRVLEVLNERKESGLPNEYTYLERLK